MRHNEALQTFHDNQHGGRKGRLSTSAILNKVLTLDIIRYFGDDIVIIDMTVSSHMLLCTCYTGLVCQFSCLNLCVIC